MLKHFLALNACITPGPIPQAWPGRARHQPVAPQETPGQEVQWDQWGRVAGAEDAHALQLLR